MQNESINHAVHTVKERAGERIESSISEQKTRAADTLSGVARSLLDTSQSVREQGNADVSRYIERAADGVDRLAGYLQRADVRDVAERVEGVARRSPGAFVAGAFAAGFLASRFLKSSRDEPGYLADGRRSYESDRSFGGSIDRGYDAGYETGSNFDLGAGSNRPRMESWRTSGYAASERTPLERNSTDVGSGAIGDPGANRGA